VSRGEYRDVARTRFDEYARVWIQGFNGRTGKGVRPATRMDYGRDLELHAIPFFGRRRLAEITLTDVRAFANHLRDRGLFPSTVRNVMAPVRALFSSAHEEGLIRWNPTAGLRLPQAERGAVKHLEPDEFERLIREIPERWRLWVRLLAYTGCRIGEFIALIWGDVNLESGTVMIARRLYQGTLDRPKSPYGVRTIPLTRELVAELRRHRLSSRYSADTDPVFATSVGTPFQPSNIFRRILKPAARRAGVGWAGFHTLRHTCGTMLARQGLRAEEIQGWLGHHAASFTQDTYIGRPKSLPDPDALGLGRFVGGHGAG